MCLRMRAIYPEHRPDLAIWHRRGLTTRVPYYFPYPLDRSPLFTGFSRHLEGATTAFGGLHDSIIIIVHGSVDSIPTVPWNFIFSYALSQYCYLLTKVASIPSLKGLYLHHARTHNNALHIERPNANSNTLLV